MSQPQAEAKEKMNRLERIMAAVERVGNALPHPFWLFTLLLGITLVLSAILSAFDWSATYETVVDGVMQETTATVINLLSFDTFSYYMQNIITTYTGYYPLGMCIFMTIAVGYAEKVGFFDALMRKMVIGAPIMIVFVIMSFVGVNSSIGFGAGVIFTMIVGAAIFKALGMHPWIGIIMGYAAANGGYTACLMIAATDTVLAGVSAQVVEANNIVTSAGIAPPTHALINYYFIAVAVFVITILTVVVTKYVTVPFMNRKHPELVLQKDEAELAKMKVNEDESRGLRWAGITTVIFFALVVIACIPKGSFMRNESGDLLPDSPFINMIIPLLFFFFLFIGTAYAFGSKKFKEWKEVPIMMAQSIDMAQTTMICFLPACLFVEMFSKSQIATVLAVKCAQILTTLNIGNIPLFLLVIALSCFVNLFITSNSGKWIMLAPFLVPMLAMMDISPAMSQVLYRIGDSCFNILSPVEGNVPIALALLETYKISKKDKVGIGTLISMEIPYAFTFLVGFIVLVLIFYFFDLPLGPGASIFMS